MQRSALCRSRRELSNAYLLAKIGVDTAENEPCKVCPLSVYRSPRSYCIYRMLYDYFPGSQTVIRRERDVLTFKILSIVHAELVGFVPSYVFSDSKLERNLF